MSTRHRAREVALQILYGADLSGMNAKSVLEDYEKEFAFHGYVTDEFCASIAIGVDERREEIDNLITEVSDHWRVERMSLVDRNILRIGIYEILFSEEIPTKVAINEAVELAKRFGSGESPAFVNGILDRISEENSSGESS